MQRAFIGVNIRSIDEELAKEENLTDLNGVYITDITKNGSAESAGIEAGDVIKKINNKKIDDVPELQEQLSQFRPGDNIIVTVERDGNLKEFPVKLKNFDGTEKFITKETTSIFKSLGAKFENADKATLKKLKLKNGVIVKELFNGKLRSVGVRQGYIITKINQTPINSVDELVEILNTNKNNGVHPIVFVGI